MLLYYVLSAASVLKLLLEKKVFLVAYSSAKAGVVLQVTAEEQGLAVLYRLLRHAFHWFRSAQAGTTLHFLSEREHLAFHFLRRSFLLLWWNSIAGLMLEAEEHDPTELLKAPYARTVLSVRQQEQPEMFVVLLT